MYNQSIGPEQDGDLQSRVYSLPTNPAASHMSSQSVSSTLHLPSKPQQLLACFLI